MKPGQYGSHLDWICRDVHLYDIEYKENPRTDHGDDVAPNQRPDEKKTSNYVSATWMGVFSGVLSLMIVVGLSSTVWRISRSIKAESIHLSEIIDVAASDDDYTINLHDCPNFDDDTSYPSAEANCTEFDYQVFCSGKELENKEAYESRYAFSPGSVAYEICGAACGSATTSYAAVCLWEAVANISAVCDGSFVPSLKYGADLSPVIQHENRKSQGGVWSCDEHAFCVSCANGNENCAKVAAYYDGISYGRTNASEIVPAKALNNLTYWCNELS